VFPRFPDVNTHDLIQIFTAAGKDLDWWQMVVRAVIVYSVTLFLIRLGKKRLFGKSTAMDVVLGVILGSVLSRSVNGSATLLSTAAAAATIIFLHALSAKLALLSPVLGVLLKGRPRTILKDGQLLHEEMRKSDLTDHDLEESLRCEARSTDASKMAEARLERNGKISFVKKQEAPKVVEVRVEQGVQTVRLEIS
jgi:uncharacterized membrane protein YcaP (DUF421 family)